MTQVQAADPAAQRRALLIGAVGIILGVVVYLGFGHWLSGIAVQGEAEPTPEGARRLLGPLIVLGIALVVPLAGFGAHVWRLGRRTVGAGRFPPPGMDVIRDTLALQGPHAVVRGRIMQGFGVALITVALVLGILLFRMVAAVGQGWFAAF
jgi:hypothetical protein